ncbi:hypothetical protein A2U01_0093724, partial [Trifolium medium]|nr:hypothetical protein [Trifolium medium]
SDAFTANSYATLSDSTRNNGAHGLRALYKLHGGAIARRSLKSLLLKKRTG